MYSIEAEKHNNNKILTFSVKAVFWHTINT